MKGEKEMDELWSKVVCKCLERAEILLDSA